MFPPLRFLSTPSARRATHLHGGRYHQCEISIHALREEGDKPHRVGHRTRKNFYPRPPRGGRPHEHRAPGGYAKISIHALREEGDQAVQHRTRRPFHFYPRPPRGGRPALCELDAALNKISIHALREEGDMSDAFDYQIIYISIHALREEGDPYWATSTRTPTRFLSTPSARRATS